MTPEEKNKILEFGEGVYTAGMQFADALDKWAEVILSHKDIEEKIKGDPDFEALNNKLSEINKRLEKYQ